MFFLLAASNRRHRINLEVGCSLVVVHGKDRLRSRGIRVATSQMLSITGYLQTETPLL